jgi:hypothetical protein
MKANGKQRKVCNTGVLLSLFFYPEDGGDMFLQKLVCFQCTTWHCIPEGSTLHNHRCENLRSNEIDPVFKTFCVLKHDRVKEDGMVRACSMHGGEKEFM